jgi:hypothetical protein
VDHEAAFRRAGLPLFIEGYSASGDVFTRAVPLLSLVFLAEVFGAIDLDWSVWANVGAIAGGLLLIGGVLAALNRVRGRPVLSPPEHIGTLELALFVVVPALLPLIFGLQVVSALVTAAGNSMLIVAILLIAYGLPSILRWAGSRLLGQLAASVLLLARALPLLLIFSLVLFVNTEMWQVLSTTPGPFLALLAGLLAGLGSLFIVLRIPREVSALEKQARSGPPLTPSQRVNVGLVLFTAQALQVLVVAAGVGFFFVAFGVLAVGDTVRDAWLGAEASVLVSVDLFGHRAQLTEELLRVSGGIAAFCGLYYAIAVLTDSTYREEFLEELTAEMRQTFELRADYLTRPGAPRA